MAKYIEREAIWSILEWDNDIGKWVIMWNKNVDDIPAADVAPVVHGRWKLHDNGNGTCSVCNCISVHVWDFDNSLNFCPHCGAKMDGDLND